MSESDREDQSQVTRNLDREIAEASARAARRSDLEGRVMRSPGGGKLLERMSRRKLDMPRVKE